MSTIIGRHLMVVPDPPCVHAGQPPTHCYDCGWDADPACPCCFGINIKVNSVHYRCLDCEFRWPLPHWCFGVAGRDCAEHRKAAVSS